MEWVLKFSATKLETPSDGESSEDSLPPWLIFRHLPIPTFPGQSLFWSETPVFQMVVSSIDGRRTLDVVVQLVSEGARRSELSMS